MSITECCLMYCPNLLGKENNSNLLNQVRETLQFLLERASKYNHTAKMLVRSVVEKKSQMRIFFEP